MGSSSICVVQRKHSGPEQVRAGSPIHRALQGLQSVDLAFGLTIAPLHFDRIAGVREQETSFPELLDEPAERFVQERQKYCL